MKGKTIIKVEGLLDKKWKSSFEAIEISYEGNNTILTGDIKDEAHLHGILNQIRDLNLKLLSVNPAEENN
jgi:beta-lactamase superfamily II metal-dependent hydrolase